MLQTSGIRVLVALILRGYKFEHRIILFGEPFSLLLKLFHKVHFIRDIKLIITQEQTTNISTWRLQLSSPWCSPWLLLPPPCLPPWRATSALLTPTRRAGSPLRRARIRCPAARCRVSRTQSQRWRIAILRTMLALASIMARSLALRRRVLWDLVACKGQFVCTIFRFLLLLHLLEYHIYYICYIYYIYCIYYHFLSSPLF